MVRPALIDGSELRAQFAAFKGCMRTMVPIIMARHKASVDLCNAKLAAAKEDGRTRTGMLKYSGKSEATMLWKAIIDSPAYCEHITTLIKLAQISHVSIAGGVQVEQLFSNLVFIKNDLRSCLQP